MRNRVLHDALREFALEAAGLLSQDLEDGAELEFDVIEERRGRGPTLYRYRPRTESFISARWPRLRSLPSCGPAGDALGAGAAQYLRVNGLRGARAEPALQAMLERLYEDTTSFGFPEERFERVYREVEGTLYRDTLPATIVAPMPGLRLEPARVELGDGLALVRGDGIDAPPEAAWPEDGDEPNALCVLERDVRADGELPATEAGERFRRLLTGLRLYKPGGVALGALGWRRAAEGRWRALELEGAGAARGEPWVLSEPEAPELCEFLGAIERSTQRGAVAFALSRFEMGCSRRQPADALPDYLLGLRALLDALSDAGRASLSLRLAALCAEEGERRAVQRRVELAQALERRVIGAAGLDAIGPESPHVLVAELEGHLRALLRDVLCGYLDPDLASVADDILLEARGEHQIEAEPPGPAVEADPPGPLRAGRMREPASVPEGVTGSIDWDAEADPESYSAPI